jgi:hypothetical protein
MALIWAAILIFLLTLIVFGYVCPFIKDQRKARVTAWLAAIGTVLFSSFVSIDQPPLTRMLIVVVLQLVSMKLLVMVETYSGENRLTAIQWIAFSLGWFGMRPALFETLPSASLPFTRILWKGISRGTTGIILLYLSFLLEMHFRPEMIFLPEVLLLAGLSLTLHFGILNLCAAFWRSFGVNVSELFRAPYRSRSLNEFWGRRWNIAFSEMTAVISYRPLKTKIGTGKALTVSFLLSGLLHEVAISLPVMAGFGLSTAYFVIHAIALQVEARSNFIRKVLQRKWLAHIWVMSVLVLPMPLLFHQDFIRQVLVPLRTLILQSIGMS